MVQVAPYIATIGTDKAPVKCAKPVSTATTASALASKHAICSSSILGRIITLLVLLANCSTNFCSSGLENVTTVYIFLAANN